MTTKNAERNLVIVTGAAGWLGRAVLHGLSGQADARVRALVADPTQVSTALEAHADAEVFVGDVTRIEDMERLLEDAQGAALIHAAGVIHPKSVADFKRVNEYGTRNVVDQAERAGVARLVHISSNSPMGTNSHPADTFGPNEPYRPYLAYGESKMRAELAVREGATPWVILRPPWFYGPHQPARQTSFFRLVRRGVFPLVGSGLQRRSMVDVRDLAQAALRACVASGAVGRSFWVADPRPYELGEIMDAVRIALEAEGLRVSPLRLRVPEQMSTLAAWGDRQLQRRGRYQQHLHVLGEMSRTIACDVSAAAETLDVRPRGDLVQGMRESIRWCLDEGIEL